MARDFRNKTFQKVLRGYAPDEVEEYIAYLNEEYRKMERRAADSERKLALAQKKLDESMKNAGTVDSVGPAAREAAAKLLREAEEKRTEILAMTERQAGESAEHIVREAEEKAAATVQAAVQEAEAILAEARAEAELHKNDAKKVYDTAHSLFGEIGAFKEKLFELYNDHLDAVEGITDAAQDFMNGIDEQYPEGAAEADTEPEIEPEPEIKEDVPAEEVSEDEDNAAEDTAEEEFAEDYIEEEYDEYADEDQNEAEEEADEPEEESEDDVIGDEVASNLAFMDRLFAQLRPSDGADDEEPETAAGEDLYIDIPEEEEDFDVTEEWDGDEEGEPEEFEESEDAEETDDGESGEPIITIDWKKRSAGVAGGTIGQSDDEDDEPVTVDESEDFRAADGFDELDEVPYDESDDGAEEENYDDYGNEYVEDYEEEQNGDDGFDEDEEETPAEDEEEDEYSGMDAIFNEDKSKREMSLTDEFNIIFSDSKSNDNVQEISRQPTVAPEAPKKPKKHKGF